MRLKVTFAALTHTHARTHTHIHTTILWICEFCPGQPRWAGTRRNVHPLAACLGGQSGVWDCVPCGGLPHFKQLRFTEVSICCCCCYCSWNSPPYYCCLLLIDIRVLHQTSEGRTWQLAFIIISMQWAAAIVNSCRQAGVITQTWFWQNRFVLYTSELICTLPVLCVVIVFCRQTLV